MSTTAPHSAIPARLLRRIEKLLALSGKPSENEKEAASAAALAQQLLFRHHLRIEDLPRLRGTRASRDGRITEQRYGELAGAQPSKWQRALAAAVAESSFCVLVNQRRWQPAEDGGITHLTSLVLIGRPDDVELARRTLDFLTEVLLRLADDFTEAAMPARVSAAQRSAYLEGAADSISWRLLAAFSERKQETAASVALVVRREHELEAYMAERRGSGQPLRTAARDASPSDEDAYFSGYADASTVPLSAPLPAIASGRGTPDGGSGLPDGSLT